MPKKRIKPVAMTPTGENSGTGFTVFPEADDPNPERSADWKEAVEKLRAATESRRRWPGGLPLRCGCDPRAVLHTINRAFQDAINAYRMDKLEASPSKHLERFEDIADKTKQLCFSLGFDPGSSAWIKRQGARLPTSPVPIEYLENRIFGVFANHPELHLGELCLPLATQEAFAQAQRMAKFIHEWPGAESSTPLFILQEQCLQTATAAMVVRFLPNILSLLYHIADLSSKSTERFIAEAGPSARGDRPNNGLRILYLGEAYENAKFGHSLLRAWRMMFERSAATDPPPHKRTCDPRGAWVSRIFDFARARAKDSQSAEIKEAISVLTAGGEPTWSKHLGKAARDQRKVASRGADARQK